MDEFLQRLKQRKLVQWALAYIAASFAFIQVTDIVAQRFGWPESLERYGIVALATGQHCGDRYVKAGDYAAIHGNLDYPCTTGLSAQAIAASAKALRVDADLVPSLRLRIADLETRMVDLTSNNRDIVEHLRAMATEQPK